MDRLETNPGGTYKGPARQASGELDVKAEAHRITCTNGHQVAATKSGTEDVEVAVIQYYGGKCLYCSGELRAQPCSVDDYDNWSSRADGRFAGNDAP